MNQMYPTVEAFRGRFAYRNSDEAILRFPFPFHEDGYIDRAVPWLSDSHQAQLALCIAGPRESEAPGIYAAATPFLRAVLDRVALRERENQNAQKQDK